MRKLYHVMFLLGILVMTGGMWSCSDDDEKSSGGNASIEVQAPAEDAISTTSATFKLITKGAESFVYKAIEGANAEAPDPVVVYAEAQANGSITPVTGETAEVTVTGLEGNKTYTVFFIFKVGKSYEIKSQVITTAQYTQMVTILETGMFDFKVHIEVPEDMYYQINFQSLENYIAFRDQFGRQDVSWVLYDGMGAASPRFKGPKTLTFAKDQNAYEGALNESDFEEDFFTLTIVPGTGYVLFVSQCGEDGLTTEFEEQLGGGDFPGPGPLATKATGSVNLKEYTEEQPSNEMVKFLGKYSKSVFFTQQATQGPGKIDVNVDNVTEKTAVISFTPSDDVLSYHYVLQDDAMFEDFVYLCGGEDGVQAAVLNYGEHKDGAYQAAYPVEVGHSYSLYVVGVYDEGSTVQTFQEFKGIIKPKESTMDAVELEIAPVPSNNPYEVSFKIRAPKGDCAYIKYLCNYTKEWWPMLNGQEGDALENKISSMLNQFGQPVIEKEIIDQINSNEGYIIHFSSMDDTESWLVVESFNAEEKGKLFYEDGCKARSARLKPEERIDSELFQKLQGSWKATMTRGNREEAPITMDVNISEGPVMMDNLPSDVKSELVEYFKSTGKTEEQAIAAVEGYFKEYQEMSKYYTQKNRDQNCIVATGFNYGSYYSEFASSWDLFKSTTYSAYSTEELFRDYGPKIYFKFEKNEKGEVEIMAIVTRLQEDGYNYLRYVDPVADWSSTLVLCGFEASSPTTCYVTEFPIEVSEDMNTITIKPRVDEEQGKTVSPGFATEIMPGYPQWDFPSKDGIVLTRVADQPKQAACSALPVVVPTVKAVSGNHFRRTIAPYGFEFPEQGEGKLFTIESMHKDLKK